jgi:hypothetical protein
MDEGDPRGGGPHVLLPGRLFIGPCHGDTVGEAVGGADPLHGLLRGCRPWPRSRPISPRSDFAKLSPPEFSPAVRSA